MTTPPLAPLTFFLPAWMTTFLALPDHHTITALSHHTQISYLYTRRLLTLFLHHDLITRTNPNDRDAHYRYTPEGRRLAHKIRRLQDTLTDIIPGGTRP